MMAVRVCVGITVAAGLEARQDEADVAPSAAEYLPASHFRQDEADVATSAAEYLPASQSKQADAPAPSFHLESICQQHTLVALGTNGPPLGWGLRPLHIHTGSR